MAKALADLRDALNKVEAVREQDWSAENFHVELTRALTTLENARMEWNSARLKFPELSGATAESSGETSSQQTAAPGLLGTRGFIELCRIGLALTWPVALVALAGFAVLSTILWRR